MSKKDDVRDQAFGLIQPLLARLGDRHPVPVELKLQFVHLRYGRVIFDEEDVYILIDDVGHIPSLNPYIPPVTFSPSRRGQYTAPREDSPSLSE
jgi:hypothetical protein